MRSDSAAEMETPLRSAVAGFVGRREALDGMRLSALVLSRFDLDARDAGALLDGDTKAAVASVGNRAFDASLRSLIADCGLAPLFVDDGPGLHHHAVRPRGYDFAAGEVEPLGMERWRADYRAMAPARQMLAATILWLYRGKRDFCWLRRVPYDWDAADGVDEMERAGVLRRWGTLIAQYPGW
jgi:hypothetical protein